MAFWRAVAQRWCRRSSGTGGKRARNGDMGEIYRALDTRLDRPTTKPRCGTQRLRVKVREQPL